MRPWGSVTSILFYMWLNNNEASKQSKVTKDSTKNKMGISCEDFQNFKFQK